MKKPTVPWAVERNALEQALESNTIKGLDSVEAENRLREADENKITHSKKITFGDILWEEVREPLILMLLVIGVLYSICLAGIATAWMEVRKNLTQNRT